MTGAATPIFVWLAVIAVCYLASRIASSEGARVYLWYLAAVQGACLVVMLAFTGFVLVVFK